MSVASENTIQRPKKKGKRSFFVDWSEKFYDHVFLALNLIRKQARRRKQESGWRGKNKSKTTRLFLIP